MSWQQTLPASATRVTSEVNRLLACALVPPGPEHDFMVPAHLEPFVRNAANWWANPDYLLFDDLVLLPQMRAEHAQLVAVVAAAAGEAQAVDLRQWLRSVLAMPQVAAEVIAEVCHLEAQRGPLPLPVDAVAERLAVLGPDELFHALLTGACPREGDSLLRTPAPNLLFARDLFACVGESIVLGWPQMPARWRDGVFARAIARHHPALRNRQALDVRAVTPGACIEGGDVLVVSDDLVLVGVGERTNSAGAAALHRLLNQERTVRVLAIHLPTQRAMMHLDTVFTFVDRGLALAYTPTFSARTPPEARVDVRDLADPQTSLGCDLAAVLTQYDHPTRVVPCGDGEGRTADREQWSDGANALCLAPGQIVLYGRNTHTLEALNREGFEILSPEQYVANATLYRQRGQRLVVALTGSELSRGRGGPRCLTLPLARG